MDTKKRGLPLKIDNDGIIDSIVMLQFETDYNLKKLEAILVDYLNNKLTNNGFEATPLRINDIKDSNIQHARDIFDIAMNNAWQAYKLLLEAAYRGTYLAALRHNNPRLFLTLIGGGVFGNSHKDIFEAIERVHIDTACTEKNATLKEVHVVMYESSNVLIEFFQNLKSKGVEAEIHFYKKGVKEIYTEV